MSFPRLEITRLSRQAKSEDDSGESSGDSRSSGSAISTRNSSNAARVEWHTVRVRNDQRHCVKSDDRVDAHNPSPCSSCDSPADPSNDFTLTGPNPNNERPF